MLLLPPETAAERTKLVQAAPPGQAAGWQRLELVSQLSACQHVCFMRNSTAAGNFELSLTAVRPESVQSSCSCCSCRS